MALTENEAFLLAKTGIESGVIKLHGGLSASSEDGAKKRGELDAIYLLSLISELQKNQDK